MSLWQRSFRSVQQHVAWAAPRSGMVVGGSNLARLVRAVPTGSARPGFPGGGIRAFSAVTTPVDHLQSEENSNLGTVRAFSLTKDFVAKFADKPPPFGFNGLGELVFIRTYSRVKKDGTREKWFETVERVVNGTYNMQRKWIEQHQLGWNPRKAQKSAQEMYRRIFDMKFLPPGRGLWAMGSPVTEERGLFAALNNCAFVSTELSNDEPSKPFAFLMDAAMLGVGVGFDTLAATGPKPVTVRTPSKDKRSAKPHVIEDSREGWVESVRELLQSYFTKEGAEIHFDYSLVRPAGRPIRGFGGVSSGPEPLAKLHDDIRRTLDKDAGGTLSVRGVVDIMNFIGRCVVAGNVRRTAEIAFGDYTDQDYIDLKNYEVNPDRAEYGWTSNNSIYATLGMDYAGVADRIRMNGEPGFAWLDNMQKYSRMGDPMDNKDARARGGNPCLEQTLESYELCCLVETFPDNHESLEDFNRTLKFAYLYAKTVTLGRTHWPDTNRVMLRNRRIGCSVSGVAQFLSNRGIHELKRWLDTGFNVIQHYDKSYSDWLAIPRSLKTTSVKPSGTVSLLAGSTPGMHFPESRHYIRRVRLDANSDLLPPLKAAGYVVEPSVTDPATVCIEFPVSAGKNIRIVREISMWEQLSLAAFLQEHWADNQVSCTVTFDPDTEGPQLQHALNYFQYRLKGISFLPRVALGAYPQMVYEEVDEATFLKREGDLTHLDFGAIYATKTDSSFVPPEAPDKFCDSTSCEIPARGGVNSEADGGAAPGGDKSP